MSQQNPLETRELTQHVKIRARVPSERQLLAVQYLAENPRNKGEALRKAGYGKDAIAHPSRVFSSETIQGLLYDVMKPEHILGRLKRHVYARRSVHMTFPTFNPEKSKERAEMDEAEGTDSSEKIRGEQMTDAEIREFIEGQNGTVHKIVHGETARHVYFYTDDTKASLDAIEKFINLYGMYAPKKTEDKQTIAVQFSLTDLRKRMDETGVEIIKPRVIDM